MCDPFTILHRPTIMYEYLCVGMSEKYQRKQSRTEGLVESVKCRNEVQKNSGSTGWIVGSICPRIEMAPDYHVAIYFIGEINSVNIIDNPQLKNIRSKKNILELEQKSNNKK